MSDNGGVKNVGDNGPQRGDKLTPYQGGIRVAAIARWPAGGIQGCNSINARTGYIDIVPTLMAAINSADTPPRAWDGIDTLSALRGLAQLPERAWLTYMDQNDDFRERLALNHDDYKLVVHRDAPDATTSHPPLIELFDLINDPAESENLAPTEPDTLSELTTALDNLMTLKSSIQVDRFKLGSDDFIAPPQWQIKE